MTREPRSVTLHALDLLSFQGDVAEIGVHCSKGTYVRTLVEDIGMALGCGAHVAGLRRLGVGPFDDGRLYDLETLQGLAAGGFAALDGILLPVESGLAQWPGLRLSGDAAFYIRQGQPVQVPQAPAHGWVRLYEGDRQFMGMGEILDDGRVAPRRLMAGGR